MLRYVWIVALQWQIYGTQHLNRTTGIFNNVSTTVLPRSTPIVNITSTAVSTTRAYIPQIPVVLSQPNITTDGFLRVPCWTYEGSRAGSIQFTRRDLLNNPTFYVRYLAWDNGCGPTVLSPYVNLDMTNFIDVMMVTARTINGTLRETDSVTMIDSCDMSCTPSFTGNNSFYPSGHPLRLTQEPVTWSSPNGTNQLSIARYLRFQYFTNLTINSSNAGILDEVIFQLDYVVLLRTWLYTTDAQMLAAIYRAPSLTLAYCDTTRQFIHAKYCPIFGHLNDSVITCPRSPLSTNLSIPTVNARNKLCMTPRAALISMGINPDKVTISPTTRRPTSPRPVTIDNGGHGGYVPEPFWNTTRILGLVVAIVGLLFSLCALMILICRCMEKRNARKAVIRDAAIAEQAETNGIPYTPSQPRMFGAMPSTNGVPMSTQETNNGSFTYEYQNSPLNGVRKNSGQYGRFN